MNTSSQGYYILNPTTNLISTLRKVRIHDSSSEEDLNCHELIRDSRVLPEQCETIMKDLNPITADENQSDDVTPTSISLPHWETKKLDYSRDYYCTVTVDYACAVIPTIPENYKQAISSTDAEWWKAAMNLEVDTLVENDTWEIVPLPCDCTEMKGKWVHMMKQSKQEGKVIYKAQYMAKGYSKIEGIDYEETFSPTTRFNTIRMLIQKAVNESLHLNQMDVKGAYLNAPIDKELCVQQPPSYEFTDESGTCFTCRLKKSLHGLRQSGQNWHATLTEHLTTRNFIVCNNDPCKYTLNTPHGQLIILFWVNDIILASNNMTLIDDIKQDLGQQFRMDDRGELRWFLRIDFKHLQDGNIIMSQEHYVNSILHHFS
jgi:hypothetical protein